MLTSPTSISTKIASRIGILVAGVALLVAGCDIASQQQEGDEGDNGINYEVTNDLSERITHFDGNSSSSAGNASAKQSQTSFEVTDRVMPPSSISGVSATVRASHLSLSNAPSGSQPRNLYVGYKVLGSEYGGGIDILNAPPSSSPGLEEATTATGGSPNALVVDDVDVQEVAVRHISSNPSALFVATAIEPQPFQKAPQFHAITLKTDDGLPNPSVSYEFEELTNPGAPPPSTIAKSVVNSPSGTGSYDALAVSDVNSLHAIQTSTNGRTISGVDVATTSGVEFRAVTETSSGNTYALSDGGTIYEFVPPSGLGQIATLPSISSDFSIARMTSHDFSGGDEFLFVALNENGFRVVNPSTGNVVFSDADIYTPSVTATDDHVYVANGDGFSIYDVEGADPTAGLTDSGRASINDLVGASATDAQVNHIIQGGTTSGGNIILYVAKSVDGVYRLEETSGNIYN